MTVAAEMVTAIARTPPSSVTEATRGMMAGLAATSA